MNAERIALIFLILLAACDARQGAAHSYSIAPTASMATVLKFDKPANLVARTSDSLDSETQRILGTPICAYGFRDFDASEYSYSIFIFPVGRAFGEKRVEFEQQMIQAQQKIEKASSGPSDTGVFDIGGRRVLRFLLGFGAGGEATGILFPHSTAPIELVVIQGIDYRKPPYPNNRVPDARPTVNFQDAIAAIEKLIEIN